MNVGLHTGTARLNVVSLCTGGGGLDLALELAIPSARSVVLVEREAFAVSALVEAMEGGAMAQAPIWTDVLTFRGRPWRGLVDGVIGGIPCQPHSEAGRRQGADDERDLWSAARRILVQSGAWFIWLENVDGMLTSGGALRVRRDLHRMGFALEGGLFTASEVGASQERSRFFVLAVADNRRLRGQAGFSATPRRQGKPPEPAVVDDGCCPVVRGDGGLRDGWATEQVGRAERRTTPSGPSPGPLFPPGPDDLIAWSRILASRPDLKPAVHRGSDGLADRSDRLRLHGNGVVPLQGAYAFRTLAARLATRGSRGAAGLVRLMDIAA